MKPGLVLPAEGAPLVFATGMAHDLFLHIESGGAKHAALDVPLTADPGKGGLVPTQPISALPGGELTAVVRGKWGFDNWEGPRYQLVAAQPGKWTLAASDQSALVVGRDDTLHIDGTSTVCVEKVEAQTAGNAHPGTGVEVAQTRNSGGDGAAEGRVAGAGERGRVSVRTG